MFSRSEIINLLVTLQPSKWFNWKICVDGCEDLRKFVVTQGYKQTVKSRAWLKALFLFIQST